MKHHSAVAPRDLPAALLLPSRAYLLALALSVTLSLAPAGAAAAQSYGERGLSPAYYRCLGRNPSNAEIGQCLEVEADRQEARLNAAYRRAMARLAPPRRLALRDAERLWVKKRERDCEELYREMEGGTGAGPARLSCLASRAAARTRWIAAFR